MADRVLELDDETQKGLMEVADLAWHCTCREPYQRPDMSHIVNTLSPLIEPWQPPTTNDINNGNNSTHILTKILERWLHWARTQQSPALTTPLSGSISPALGNLTSLTSLQLKFNNICGPLPRLSKLSLLQQIYLRANAFDSIPSGFFIELSSL
ncbi:hypothetical protein ZIOFF_050084 [Zingiber officinale]|uniref:Uncharacterized protein n=1 Tax=Zingiber officinale TaxID=94328 RepID=A0A8J5FJQ8_ZINOF|nr:hypothetical protein ZIOFF_050084 [Zingiber officinale]